MDKVSFNCITFVHDILWLTDFCLKSSDDPIECVFDILCLLYMLTRMRLQIPRPRVTAGVA